MAIICFGLAAFGIITTPTEKRGNFGPWFYVVVFILFGGFLAFMNFHVRSGEEWKLVQAEKRARKYGR
jgi:hypothetical protein